MKRTKVSFAKPLAKAKHMVKNGAQHVRQETKSLFSTLDTGHDGVQNI